MLHRGHQAYWPVYGNVGQLYGQDCHTSHEHHKYKHLHIRTLCWACTTSSSSSYYYYFATGNAASAIIQKFILLHLALTTKSICVLEMVWGVVVCCLSLQLQLWGWMTCTNSQPRCMEGEDIYNAVVLPNVEAAWCAYWSEEDGRWLGSHAWTAVINRNEHMQWSEVYQTLFIFHLSNICTVGTYSIFSSIAIGRMRHHIVLTASTTSVQ